MIVLYVFKVVGQKKWRIKFFLIYSVISVIKLFLKMFFFFQKQVKL